MMTSERFQALAHAYGGELRRWPEEERASANAHLAIHPGARDVLAAEAALDALLDQYVAPPPSALLRERIIASAGKFNRPVWRRGGAWVSGAGMAAACVLGVLVGANLWASLFDAPPENLIEASTAFDGTGYFDALENAG